MEVFRPARLPEYPWYWECPIRVSILVLMEVFRPVSVCTICPALERSGREYGVSMLVLMEVFRPAVDSIQRSMYHNQLLVFQSLF